MRALPCTTLMLAAVWGAACSTVAAPAPESVSTPMAVAHSLGSRQCEAGGTTPQALAERLREAGVSVATWGCGHDGRMRPAVCGAGNGQIAVLEIDPAQLAQARQLGFTPLVDWPDARRQPCRMTPP
jgi:D-arabinose 1-dehydrogenase-like Zn-dependent alcohol dehydrogenase